MAYKTDKLQARIAEKFGTQSAFAEAIGMDKTTLNRVFFIPEFRGKGDASNIN